MSELDDVVRSLSNEQLVKGGAKTGRRSQALTLLIAASLLAGIWVDWRFLPTALVFVLLLAVNTAAAKEYVTEANRRVAEHEAKGSTT